MLWCRKSFDTNTITRQTSKHNHARTKCDHCYVFQTFRFKFKFDFQLHVTITPLDHFGHTIACKYRAFDYQIVATPMLSKVKHTEKKTFYFNKYF